MEPEDFAPRKGGMVDSARQQAAQAVLEEDQAPAGHVEYPAVRVAVQSPEVTRARTIVVATGTQPWAQALGLDANRRTATLMALDNPVVLATSAAARDDPRNAAEAAGLACSGFTLPVGVPVVVTAKAQMFAVATSAAASRVSVLEELYEPQ